MSFSFMPLYTGDYLRDTRHLSVSEHGAYFLALTYCWDSKGPMPLDERKQFAIVGCRSGDEMEAWRRVRDEFFVRMEDGWYQPRMQREVERSENISRSRSEAGKKGYEAKAKQLPSKSQAIAKQVPLPPPPQPCIEVPPSPTETPVLVASPAAKQPEAAANEGDEQSGVRLPACPTAAVIDLYHQHLPMLPRCEVFNDARKRFIAARWREVAHDHRDEADVRAAALDWFAWFFRERVASSPFLIGKVKDWRADLDWLMKPTNFAKAAEGRYQREKATR